MIYQLLNPVFSSSLDLYYFFDNVLWKSKVFKKSSRCSYTKNVKTVGPSWVERTVDNYNHLFEQPVAFYAITISIAIINNFDPILIQWAWAFVCTRILHSIVQITCNIVVLRFILFVVGWLIIAYMSFSQLSYLNL